jgi:precorrin-3B C17-methyltransferase
MGTETKIQKSDDSGCKGALYVIGIGPGSLEELTPKAKKRIAKAEVIVGYGRYIDLIEELTEGKEIFQTPMKGEVERCTKAIELAGEGRRVAVISSGDAGIYGMAGLVLELIDKEEKPKNFDVEIVPGMPAFVSAASILGAPLMHDFASISLSDLLTPWELITKRLEMAAKGDFVVAIYNPRSKGRTTQLSEAIEILREHKEDKTPVGIVRNAAREEESVTLTTLGELPPLCETIDMLTVLIIGNSSTLTTKANEMVTPRGYKGV